MKKFFIYVFAGAITSLFAEKQSFDRYQSIIDRQPFGQPPAGFNPQQMAGDVTRGDSGFAADELSVEQQEIQQSVSFSMINAEGDGLVMVGFSDRSNPKAPKHYYLAVGDTQDGWTVKACDPVQETLTLVKNEIEVSLKLGDQTKPNASAKGQRSAVMQPGQPMNQRLGGGLRSFGMGGNSMSYKGRRARREMEEAKARADAEAREAEKRRLAEEKAAADAADKAAREIERAEQRQQLQAIQEELRKNRESKERNQKEEEFEI